MKRLTRVGLLSMAAVIASASFVSPGLAAKKKLRFWVPYGSYSWQQMEAKFEKANPNVDVQVLTGGDIDKFYAMVTAGLMPDVWGPWGTPGITADVNRDWAADLTPYITRDGKSMDIDDFFPGLMRNFKIKGKQYALPIFYYVDWFFYDTQRYAQAGLAPPPLDPKDRSWTWDVMVANAMKTTTYTSQGAVQKPGLEFNRDMDVANWPKLWGVDMYDAEAMRTSIPQHVAINTPGMTNALTKVWDLIYRHKVTKPVESRFLGKQVAAAIESGWNILFVMPLKGFKWALAPLPYAKTNTGITYPDGWRISRLCADKELAWKFVKFLCEPDSMRLIVRDDKSTYKGTGVARKSVFGETMATDIAKASGMRAADILRIYEGADDVGVVDEGELICLHSDMNRVYLMPILNDLWANKVSPVDAAAKMQTAADKALPTLFKRWIRDVEFAGANKAK